jgi:hypothetical protein
MDGTKIFSNELGNTITVQVQEQVINGIDGVFITIEGPTSKTDLHITRAEAKVLFEQLRLTLGDH